MGQKHSKLKLSAKSDGQTEPKTAFGTYMRSEFPFDPEWRNLNHGECRFSSMTVLTD